MASIKANYQRAQIILILLSSLSTVALFIYLNHVQPHYFIDEVFHVPQTLQYCSGNFTEWNPKITTLPGLYLLAASILSPLNLCNIFYLRCINLLGTFFNFFLVYNIIQQISENHLKQKWNDWTKLAVTYIVVLFPPLFFWHFLYYTDVVSVSTVLLILLSHLRKRFKTAAFVGLLAVLIRQTNIVWVAFFAIEQAFDLLDHKMRKTISYKEYCSVIYLKLLWRKITEEWNRGWKMFVKFIVRICVELLPYATVCSLFLAFIVWNKGIVVGDRTAHVPTIHVPQLLYYSAFLFCFSWPYMIVHWKSYLNFIKNHWIFASFSLLFLTIAVHSNTLVHPYVLADNRHYVFYFWNKFMRKYELFKYCLIPIYSFTLYTTLHGIKHLRFITQINYILMVSLVLVPQLLVEPRYFIIPYIFYRLLIQKPKKWQIIMELITVLLVNFLQFYIFVKKEFYWSDQPNPQRISW